MVIKIDEIKDEGIDLIDGALNEYIEAIKNYIFNIDSLINAHNVIDNSGLGEEFNKIIEGENALINSYLDNVLISFRDSLAEFKRFKKR